MDTQTDQQHHAHLCAVYLAEATQWRNESLRARTTGIRAQCRRYMRQSALSWRRKFADL
jgi:hypothetical protein